MTEKQLNDKLLADNIRDLFEGYLFTAKTFTERCIVEKIWRDILNEIKNSYSEFND